MGPSGRFGEADGLRDFESQKDIHFGVCEWECTCVITSAKATGVD